MPLRRVIRVRGWLLVLLALGGAGQAFARKPDHVEAPLPGEAIYREGLLPSGQPLTAIREGGAEVTGEEVACVKCHRRSGFGGKESRISIPPVTGRYLMHPRAATREDLDLPFVEGMRADRDPYTDETLARAIREGTNSEGKPLNYLMPRYQLGEADMAALVAYLKHLDRPRNPGVEDTLLHFATIVTPEADPVARQGMLDVLNRFFNDKNTFPIGASPALRSTRRMMYMVNRQWQLHVWELHGAPGTWQAQLEQKFRQEPVLSVVSGIGGLHWAPVHRFCEQHGVPCLYPNVEAPPAEAEKDYYSLYFSRGVVLEAQLIAKRLLAPHEGQQQPRRVVQIYRTGDVGEAGAAALATLLEAGGVKAEAKTLGAAASPAALREALHHAGSADALVLWLRPKEIAALDKVPVPKATTFLSGLMAGLDHVGLPPAWREQAYLTYPVALPDERRINVDFAFGWLRVKRVPVVAEHIQADTFLACSLLAETLKHMVDNFVPEYLLERIEDMIDRRLITGYYPHLTLAQGQRFASKGGYLVQLAKPPARGVVADGKWTVP